MLPKESDHLRLHRHSAIAPGAQQLTLTSSSTQHRPRCLRSHISSGYIATRLHRHSAASPLDYIATRLHLHSAKSPLGHSARSPAAHFDELIYSAHVTLPKESDQLRLYRHSATSPLGYIATQLYRHSAIAPGAQQLALASPIILHKPCSLRISSTKENQPTGAQQLALASPIILHGPCSLGVSSAQANQLTGSPTTRIGEHNHPT